MYILCSHGNTVSERTLRDFMVFMILCPDLSRQSNLYRRTNIRFLQWGGVLIIVKKQCISLRSGRHLFFFMVTRHVSAPYDRACRCTDFAMRFSLFFTGERSAVRIVPHGNIHIIYIYGLFCNLQRSYKRARLPLHGTWRFSCAKKAVCFAMTINKIITFAPKDSK